MCTPPSFTFAVTGYRARATTHFCSSGYNEKSAGKRKEKRAHWPHRAIELVRRRRQQWLVLFLRQVDAGSRGIFSRVGPDMRDA